MSNHLKHIPNTTQLKCLIQITIFFQGCERCTQKCHRKNQRQVFPVRESAPLRTQESIDKIASDPDLLSNERLSEGIMRRTPLLDIAQESFRVPDDLALDSLHLLHLGLTRGMVEKMFRMTSPPLSHKPSRDREEKKIVDMLNDVKLPTEFARKIRPIITAECFKLVKGSEWAVFGLHLLPAVVQNFDEEEDLLGEPNPRRLERLLATYNYLIRTLHLDNDEYLEVKASIDLPRLLQLVVTDHAVAFAGRGESYNAHMLRHILESRERTGPMYSTSTDKYESSYSVLIECFRKGTTNVAKQAISNWYMRDLESHKCRNKRAMVIKDNDTELGDDTLVKLQSSGKYFKIVDMEEDGITATAHEIVTSTYKTRPSLEIQDLNWDLVGVRKFVGFAPTTTVIHKKDIECKIIKAGRTIVETPNNWIVC